MKAAVLGAGRMGKRHIQAAREAGLDVVAVVDPSEAALASVEQEYAVPRAALATDPRRLLEASRPDLVIVAATAQAHGPLTRLAAELGAKFVLCEKPMATSLAECDRMIEACGRAGTRLAVNHQIRFAESYREAKRLLASPEIGGVSGIMIATGNVGIAMNGTHCFELFRFITDETPAEVTAWLTADPVPNPRGPQFVDHGGTVHVRTASGKRLVLDCAVDQGHGFKAIFSGRYGQIVLDELSGQATVTVRDAKDRGLPTSRYGTPSVVTARTFALPDAVALSKRSIETLISGGDTPGAAEGRLAVAVAVAAHVSHEHGHRPVPIDGSLPVERVFPWA